MGTMPSTSTELPAVVQAIHAHERFLVVTHENPDGDALGSMLALTLGLRAVGKDVLMYLAGRAPLPAEYRFLSLAGLTYDVPDDLAERVLLAVDCANERRIGEDTAAVDGAGVVVNVDHHHDN